MEEKVPFSSVNGSSALSLFGTMFGTTQLDVFHLLIVKESIQFVVNCLMFGRGADIHLLLDGLLGLLRHLL